MSASAPPRSHETDGTGGPGFLRPLAAMFCLQVTGAFLLQVQPALAPVLAATFGWPDAAIGSLFSISMAGAVAFLIAGTPLLRALGPVRSVQTGLLLGAGGVAALASPFWLAPVLASVLIGLGYGPSTPAGSDILHRYAPPRHRALVFSVKQAGVPLGGALAGLALPALVAFGGLHAALAFAGALCLLAVAMVQPVRAGIDAGREAGARLRPGAFLAADNLKRPFAALGARPGLATLALAGLCLGLNQSAWNAFLVTYLVVGKGLSLGTAGALLALMHTTGIVGRIALGWLADRLGGALPVIGAQALAALAVTLALAAVQASWPGWALALVAVAAGLSVMGWNGLQLAELARRSPPGKVGETAAGGSSLVFLGFIGGPLLLGAIVAATGRLEAGFLALAAPPGLAALLLARTARRAPLTASW